ncbi:MAG TPA: hypothetical protein VFI73_11870 [Candidatus Nitrosopolaris sp.]|nr:hypothetical protein [Candidatus Nitrosopolaris sp.]
MAIEPRLVTVGSIITLILASAATTSIVYGQTGVIDVKLENFMIL